MPSRLDHTADHITDAEIPAVDYTVTRILLATDGSSTAVEATAVAVGMAKRLDAEIVACYVDTGRVVEPLEGDMLSEAEGVRHTAAGLRVAALYGERSGVTVRTVIAEGAVAGTILSTARGEDCAMIVLGNSGRTGVQRLMLGSVAEEVVREARVPVLVVKNCSTRFCVTPRMDD